jgi:hypothetical protein
VEAATPITLPEECGSAIRGALVTALRQHYCPDAMLRPRGERIEQDPTHRAICPVCWLIALEDDASDRGRNVPRPYTIEPPVDHPPQLAPGEQFGFGASLIGRATNLFPYLVLAVPEMGRLGLGPFDPRQGGRGRFLLRGVSAVNPLSGARQPLLEGGAALQLPAVPVDAAQVANAAESLSAGLAAAGNRLAITFRTPTRIVADGRLVHRPDFLPLYQRLCERLAGLARYGSQAESAPPAEGGEPSGSIDERARLLAAASRVETVEDFTTWVEVSSGSRRSGRVTPVSGYRGRAVYHAADWRPLLPALLWGQSLHVGKSAVKGDGWFSVELSPFTRN